jgi:hypothetical protein
MPVNNPIRCILGLIKSVLSCESAKLIIAIFLVLVVAFAYNVGSSYAS